MAGRDSGLGIRSSGLAALIGLGFLVAGTMGAAEKPSVRSREAALRLTVRIYDYAGIAARTLQAASQEAATVLGKAGFETDWRFCEAAQGQVPETCNQPLQRGELAVRIVPRAKPKNGALGFTECGSAVENSEGLGAYATLYADCLSTMPSIDGLMPSAMLGHLLAHEIGHLLLRGKDHADKGIMRPQMREEDWKLAAVGMLVFTPQQAALLRTELAARRRILTAPEIFAMKGRPPR